MANLFVLTYGTHTHIYYIHLLLHAPLYHSHTYTLTLKQRTLYCPCMTTEDIGKNASTDVLHTLYIIL